jgi:hypothetical protein
MSTAARMLNEVFRPRKDKHPMTAQQQLAELNSRLSRFRELGMTFRPVSEKDDPFCSGVIVNPDWPKGGCGFMAGYETFTDEDAVLVSQALNAWTLHGPAIAELIQIASAVLHFLPDDQQCCGSPVYCGPEEPPDCCGQSIIPRDELAAALRKLTQDMT